MALDGATLYCLAREIRAHVGERVDKISQPSREEVILTLRGKEGGGRLLLCASAASPRIHFTKVPVENPSSPPMFCMLLRKHIGSGKLTAVRQQGLERILYLDFEAVNEMGDLVIVTLAMEVMARHSNLILLNQEGKILDAIKRVDATMSGVRQVLPGMTYQLPPPQERIDWSQCSPKQTVEAAAAYPKDQELSKCLQGTMQGISPIVARELAFYALRGKEKTRSQLEVQEWERLCFAIGQAQKFLLEQSVPTMVLDGESRPKDFSFLPIYQYGHALFTRNYEDFSQLLDSFFKERDRLERMKQRSHDLLRFLINASDRISRKMEAQKEELEACKNREQLKLCAELITANSWKLEKGISQVQLENYYDPALPLLEIKLEPSLTPMQNAQRYYRDYRKAVTAEQKLHQLLLAEQEELDYLDTVFDAVTRTEGESELAEIREELAQQGYSKRKTGKKGKTVKVQPLRYRSSDGFLILVGRNNLQNDRLTLKEARSQDLWFHTQKIPGSHTVVVTEGKSVPDRTLEEAAAIAAYHSKARDSAQVSVDYTLIKYVKKQPGAAPGKVIYTDFQTAVVTPSQERAEQLKERR